MAKRKKNPSTLMKVGLVALIGGGLYAGSKYLDERRKKEEAKKKKDKVSSLSGVYAENATFEPVGDYVLNDIAYPLDLKVEDLLYLQVRDDQGNIVDLGRLHAYGSGAFAAFRQNQPVPLEVTVPVIGHLVTNLTGVAAQKAYGEIFSKVASMNWADLTVRDKIVTETLKTVAPKASWTKFEPGTPHWRVYGGVTLIGEIANQSIANQQA